MTARKASSKKKAGAKKKASSKKASSKKAPAKKSTSKKKAGAKKPAPKKAVAKKAVAKKAAAKTKTPAAKPGASSMQVSMGHMFALRPRVVTSFRPDDFRRARQLLADESYANIQEAARAVAERALELTHGGPEGIRKPKPF